MYSIDKPILTIGHSTHSLEAFVALLQKHGVTALADVRSAPYSRFNPQFNRDAFKQGLMSYGIKYAFLGRELGGRSDDPSLFERGRIQYTLLARTDVFLAGIDRLIRGLSDYRIVLMCAEKEPLECHRSLLVARALVGAGITVQHIHADGCLESHEAAMDRLLDVVGLPHEDLYHSRDELISEALIRQAGRVAYFDERFATRTRGE